MTKTGTAIHLDHDFRDLLLEVSVANSGKLSPAFVEKDYWVTQTLASLVATGLDIWFKGGTALGKGFGVIRRFSEDLDLKIQGTANCPLPPVESWTSLEKKATAERRKFFEALKERLSAIGLSPEFAVVQDEAMRGVNIECAYPGAFKDRLKPPFKSFILLEVGHARVTPFVERPISSFVHDFLERGGILDRYDDPRPTVRCIHPLVTLIEKLDAIGRYYHRDGDDFRPERFVRHYDDAAEVLRYLMTDEAKALPGAPLDARALIRDMLASKDLRAIPVSSDAAFVLLDRAKRERLESAHAAISAMYWGDQPALGQACETIRAWIEKEIP